MMGTADADAPSRATRHHRRSGDLAFLSRLRACTQVIDVDHLMQEQIKVHASKGKSIPEWRYVALMRAYRRIGQP